MESKRGIRESIAEDVIRQKMDAILDEKQKKELKLWEDGRKVGKKYEDLFDEWSIDNPEARHAAVDLGIIGLADEETPWNTSTLHRYG